MNSGLNIYEQQARNRLNTVLLLLLYAVLFALAGAGVDLAMSERFGGGLYLSVITIPILVVMVGQSVWKIVALVMKRFGLTIDFMEGSGLAQFSVAVAGLAAIFGLFFYWKFALASYLAVQYGKPTELDKLMTHGSRIYFSLPFGTVTGLVFGVLTAAWGYYRGTRAIVVLSGLAMANAEEEQDRRLMNVVEEMSLAAGIPLPAVYVLPDDDPNAFAIGTSPNHCCVVVTSGLLKELDRDELQAVVAHEISHIRNKDTRVMTLVSILFGSIVLITAIARRGMLFGAAVERERVSMFGSLIGFLLSIMWLGTVLLAPLASRLIAMGVSRNREYLADASAAELTRNPRGLIHALEKLEAAVAPTRSVQTGIEHLCIVDPLERPINNKEGFWADLLSTHPPIKKRIMCLKAMAYE